LGIFVIRDYLEWSKELLAYKLKIILNRIQRNINRSWLKGTIHCRNRMVLKWFSTEKEFSARESENTIDVLLDVDIIPSEHRTDS